MQKKIYGVQKNLIYLFTHVLGYNSQDYSWHLQVKLMLDVLFKSVAFLKDYASFEFITLKIFTCLLINKYI
jgi:hypothetical protein